MAFLNKGLTITIVDERPDHKDDDGNAYADTFRYDEGLIDYVRYLTGSKEPVHPSVIAVEADRPDRGISLEVAMQWNMSYTESVHTFANTINTHEGGTHEEGFRAALTNTANKWGENWGLIKKPEDRLSGDDIREGLTAIISIKLAEPQFEGQTKTKLGNTEARSFVQQVVNAKLGDWFEQNPGEGKLIIRKGQAAAIARIAARKARDAARDRKGLLGRQWAARQAARTASRPTRRSARSSSSRVTRPAVRPRVAAIRGSRRSCRSAARSSTSRRRGSTGSCRTTRCRRSSPRSAPASTRTSTSPSFGITRSS